MTSLAIIFKNFFGNSEILLALITPFMVYYLLLIFKNKEPKTVTFAIDVKDAKLDNVEQGDIDPLE